MRLLSDSDGRGDDGDAVSICTQWNGNDMGMIVMMVHEYTQ